jgi:hypothetical protein
LLDASQALNICIIEHLESRNFDMERFSFGAMEKSILQFAYTVDDIENGMRRYTELLRIGPWFLIGPFVPAKGLYRGAVTKMEISLAVAFAGEVMVELIEQHDAEPSVYQETLNARGAHGFHHWAIGARDFDATVDQYKSNGYREAFSDISPRGVRIVYLDTSADLPGMLEIIEMTADVEEQYKRMYDAARTWDGKLSVVRLEPKRPPQRDNGCNARTITLLQ